MIKVVFDTNIFIDALTEKRKDCEDILNYFDTGKYKIMFSQNTVGELIYVTKMIGHQLFKDEDTKISLLQYVTDIFFRSKSVNTIRAKGQLEVYCKDKFDDMFLECAYAGEVDYLVTNDVKSGLLDIEYYNFKVVTTEEFLSLLDE